jgi:putative spermidine/putrescine transport system permease protein
LVLAEPAPLTVWVQILGEGVPTRGPGDGKPLALDLDRLPDDAALPRRLRSRCLGLAKAKLRWRAAILLVFLLPQAFPNLPIYINIARIFFSFDLNGTVLGVVLVHAAHGLVYSIWIATAAFAAIDDELEMAARNIGASPFRAFCSVTLPLAAPGIAASAIFVFLESLDEFTATYFVGAPEVRTLPLLLFSAAAGGNMQIAAITALILLVPSVLFMLVVERFLRAEVLARVGH